MHHQSGLLALRFLRCCLTFSLADFILSSGPMLEHLLGVSASLSSRGCKCKQQCSGICAVPKWCRRSTVINQARGVRGSP